MNNFSEKDDDEIYTVGFDFAALLAAGETIIAVTFAIRASGTPDASSATMLSGGPSINGSVVKHLVIGGLPGIIYRISATVITSSGHKYVESADLAVVERE